MAEKREKPRRIDRRAARRARVLLWIEGIAAVLVAAATVAVGAAAAFVYVASRDIPDLSPLEDYADPSRWSLPTKVLAADGSLIATFQEERRDIIPFDRIPQAMRDAIVAAEDQHFWRAWHWGVDPVGVARAAWTNLVSGEREQGASTITMQLARNLFLTRERTYRRKFKEAILALQIERRFTKEEILERYLNKVYFGRQAYGIAAAAERYFGKRLALGDSLTLGEAAFLAGLPQLPDRYGRDTEAAIDRQAQVLARMVEDGYATRAEAEEARRSIVESLRAAEALRQAETYGGIEGPAPWFAEHVRRELLKTWSEEAIYRGGLEVHTTLDTAVQRAAEAALAAGLDRLNAEVAARYARGRAPARRIEGAIVALEPRSGRILAMVGGSKWSSENQFNRAVQARRQPGSAFKPFIFAAALLHGEVRGQPVTPATILFDTPLAMDDGSGERWEPKNYDLEFRGPVTVRQALVKSINIPTIELIRAVGPEAALEMARACGIRSPLPPVLSLALGTGEVTPLELAAAYGVFAHRGVWTEPIPITYVKNREGFVEREYRPQVREAIDPNLADLMASILRDVVVRGTAAGAVGARLDRPAAGKTGTTDEYTDAWFVGFTPEMVAAVWVGYDEGKVSMGRGMTGAHAAGFIWSDFVGKALAGRPVVPFRPFDGLVEAAVDPRTGLRSVPTCAALAAEVFLPGRLPPECSPAEEQKIFHRFLAGVASDTRVRAEFPEGWLGGDREAPPTAYPTRPAAGTPAPAADRLGIGATRE